MQSQYLMVCMRILVIAGMIDAKLTSKILPLQSISEVNEIDLVRRVHYQGEKINCHTPPTLFLKFLPLAELWRLGTLMFLAIFKRPQVIIAFGTVPHGVYAWLIGKLTKTPVIQHVMGKNDLRLTFPGQIGRGLTLHAVRHSKAIAVRGTQMASWLTQQGIPSERLFSPQNIHNFDLFCPDDIRKPEFDLIYVGLLSPYKRVDLLLNAFAQSSEVIPNLTLLIVGDGSERTKLEKLAEALKVREQVCFAGKQSISQLPKFYQNAKVFIMTSQGDGLPMAMIEAMSCGLPAIVPNDADFCDVANPKNALIIRSHTSDAFSQGIVSLFLDEQKFQSLKHATQQLRQENEVFYSVKYQTALWRKWVLKN